MYARVVLAVLPEYRKVFLKKVMQRSLERGDRVAFIAGDVHLDDTITTPLTAGVTTVHNSHFFGRRILWQNGALKELHDADVVVADLNPRSLTAWLIIILSKLQRRRVLVWGHIHPRAGAGSKTMPIRRAMRRLADGVISYTWNDAADVVREDPDAQVWVAANGLYSESDIGVTGSERRNWILYVGRLEPAKKPLLAVKAFASAIAFLPPDVCLVFVGSGSLEGSIATLAVELNIASRVKILGHVSDVSQLRDLYSRSIVSISPGYVGLSLTQSLGFGVPMIVADDEPHAPEVELLTEESGWRFTSGSVEALAELLIRVCRGQLTCEPNLLVSMVRHRYSADAMAKGFFDALLGVRQVSIDHG